MTLGALSWPVTPLPLTAALAVALVTLAVANAALRSPRSVARRTLVVLLNLLLAIALVALVFPPRHAGAPAVVTLLTAGSTQTQRTRALRAPVALAMSDVALSAREHRSIRHVEDLATIRRQYPAATSLSVHGFGLDAQAWRDAPGFAIEFSPSPPVAGVLNARWPRRLDTGEPLTVRGQLVALGAPPLRVSLLDPAGEIAATASSTDDGTFRLDGQTRAPGRFVYALRVEREDGSVVETAPLAVHVVTPEATRLLMLWSSPSFESRALKDWARRGGARIAVRTAISRDRYRMEYVNRDALPLGSIDDGLLSQFDLLVADERAWSALNPAARASIARRSADHGLGVLLTVTGATDAGDLSLPFPSWVPGSVRPSALDIDLAETAAVTVRLAAAVFENRPRALVTDVAGETVAAFAPFGDGRLGVTLVTDSHRLLTTGHDDLHARYWQALVSALVPTRIEPGFDIDPELPRPGQRVQVCAYDEALPASATLTEEHSEPLAVALRPHRLRPGEACGYVWPDRTGWHEVRVGTGARSFYVYTADAWQARRAAQATAATQLAAMESVASAGTGDARPRPLPRWWFALVLLVVAAALWLEQKWHETVHDGASA